MLELRPTCEHCNKALPPASPEARICAYECTFCAACVDDVLHNVCPNCGGGFVARPVRPAANWKDDNFWSAQHSKTRDALSRFWLRTRSKTRDLVILSKWLATKLWAKTRASPKGCSQNRRRTVAWSRGPACGDVTVEVRMSRVD